MKYYCLALCCFWKCHCDFTHCNVADPANRLKLLAQARSVHDGSGVRSEKQGEGCEVASRVNKHEE